MKEKINQYYKKDELIDRGYVFTYEEGKILIAERLNIQLVLEKINNKCFKIKEKTGKNKLS